MATFKGNILLTTQDAGWSETYWFNAANHADAMTALDTLCTLRMALSPATVTVTVLRVSQEGVKGDSLLQGATTPSGTYVAVGIEALEPNLGMQVSGYSAAHTEWTHWFIRGIPTDQVEIKAPAKLKSVLVAPWPASLTAYKAGLVAAVSLNTKKPNPPGTKHLVAVATTGHSLTLVNRKAGRPFHLRRGRRVIV